MPAEAAPARLWLPELASEGSELALGAEDARYVMKVCRARPGESVSATDGKGAIATLTVLGDRHESRVRVERLRYEPRPPASVIACGAPEGDRADWLIEKLAELGISDLQPLECERGGWERFASRRARLERLAVAGLRQSRRAWLLAIRDPLPLVGWLDRLAAGTCRWLADIEGEVPGSPGHSDWIGAVGPSGGFGEGERERLIERGFVRVRLAAGRLRTETAALGLAGLRAAMTGA